jgi:hypothetical protein
MWGGGQALGWPVLSKQSLQIPFNIVLFPRVRGVNGVAVPCVRCLLCTVLWD